MKLSRTVSYALQATLQLAAHDSSEPIPCSRLAAEGAMPERFLLQILRSLVTHGVLRSTRGVDGGYMLLRPLDDLSLLQIIEAIDGPLAADLSTVERLPRYSRERLEESLETIVAATRDQLASVKLSSLASPNGAGNGAPSEKGEPSDSFLTRRSDEVRSPNGNRKSGHSFVDASYGGN
jgi:Rrf2 family protein